MFHRYLKLFKQKRSRYISWDILFFWGIGLWIALCASNMYHSNILKHEATLFYLQNSNFEIPYNISTKAEIMEEMLHITTTKYSVCNIILMLKDVFQCVHIFISMSLVIFFMCLQEYVKIVIKIWNTMAYKYSPHVLYFISLGRNLKKDSISSKNIRKCDDANLHTKLTVKFENCKEHLRTKLNRDDKDVYTLEKNKNFNELNTNIYIIQNEIIFNSYTLLLSNNYELYQYFSNQQLKNNLMHKYLLDQSCAYIKNDLKFSNNYKRSDDGPPKKYIQKRIVSSSPEFQKFLANLRKPQFFNPCISGVSARYIIRIKSTYK